MSRIYVSLVRAVCLASLAICNSARAVTFNYTHPPNGFTYTVVEADPFLSGGSPGNTVNMNNPGQFFAHTAVANLNGLYRWRDFGVDANMPPAAPGDPDVFEISDQDVAPPDLRTTISGLPNATYDVYLAFTVEGFRPSNPIHPGTLGADLDVGQEKPTTLRGGRAQPGLILSGIPPIEGAYEFTLAPLGQVTGTEIKVLVGPMWAGDLNDDYKIGQDDLNIVLSNWLQPVTPGDRTRGDTNGDGFITQTDINNVVYEAWGQGGYPSGRRGDYIGVAYKLSGAGTGAGIPEPSSIALVVAAGVALMGLRLRKKKSFGYACLVMFLILAAVPRTASAAIDGTFVQVTSEEGQSPPANRVSQDLAVNATTDWLGSQLLITLSPPGNLIYQDFFGGVPDPIHAPPNPGSFGSFPTLRFDTYVTGSGGVAGGPASSAGAAVDIGGINNISTGGTFNSAKVDLQWYTTNTSDIGAFTLGRFTLTNTAQGTWALRLDSKDQTAPFLLNGTIQNGLLIPNPAGVPGDYNNNGKVDSGDYVLWRKGGPLQNEVDAPGTVNAADYTAWRARFGNPPGSGSGSGLGSSSAVPEPCGALSLISVLMIVATSSRTSLRRHSK